MDPGSNGTSTPVTASGRSTPVPHFLPSTRSARRLEDTVLTGFQLSTREGPLCKEPTQGLACFIESIQVSVPEDELRLRMGLYSGQVISAVRDAVDEGFLQWSPRIMLAVYNVDIQASSTPKST